MRREGEGDDERSQDAAVAARLEALVAGELGGVEDALAALPAGHPRRPMLEANLRTARALLADLPRILGARGGRARG